MEEDIVKLVHIEDDGGYDLFIRQEDNIEDGLFVISSGYFRHDLWINETELKRLTISLLQYFCNKCTL